MKTHGGGGMEETKLAPRYILGPGHLISSITGGGTGNSLSSNALQKYKVKFACQWEKRQKH